MLSTAFDLAGYRHFLTQRKVMGSRCLDSGEIYLPPRPICPKCQSRNMEWVELSGEGVVAAFTSIAVVSAAMAERGYGNGRPYVTGFVALKEGPTVAARIEGGNRTVHVGMRVQADFLEESSPAEGNPTTLIFRPA